MALSKKINVRRKKYGLKWLWQASIIPEVSPIVLFYGFVSLLVVFLYESGRDVAFSTIGLAIPGVVLGLLLVFRTNTAYDRFWEARKLWGSQINTSRSLAQSIWTVIPTVDQSHTQEKQKITQLLPALAVATKLHLRSEPLNQELSNLISTKQYEFLSQQANPPLTILGWLRIWIKQQFQRNLITDSEYVYLFELIDILNSNLGAYDRILNTPMPLAYALHLQHLIHLYCFLFPLKVVDTLEWLTIPTTCLVAFALFGIEKIGLEIQAPFGYQENDLELDRFCDSIRHNVAEIVTSIDEYQNYTFTDENERKI